MYYVYIFVHVTVMKGIRYCSLMEYKDSDTICNKFNLERNKRRALELDSLYVSMILLINILLLLNMETSLIKKGRERRKKTCTLPEE